MGHQEREWPGLPAALAGRMVKALFDTNILIDYLNGMTQARAELALYADKAISIVTWMEVQVGATPIDQLAVDHFLLGFTVLPVDTPVSVKAVALRKSIKIKLPDAIIWATALVNQRLLITRNSKDFSPSAQGVRVPYII
ncbi:MAG: type II toxin-antitoxin system VapC family toxin [Rhodoferax ferrireducens]